MELTEETKKSPASSKSNMIIIILLIVLIIAVLAAILLRGDNNEEGNNLAIDYATDASVMMDQDSLQAAMDAASENAEKGNVALRYVNDAYSTDGVNFDCLIANSPANIYDMYLQIFADDELQDEVFQSGLVPPGSGFESITLNHALDPGVTTVYVVLTQVETSEGGAQALVNQVIHTMDFHVDEATEE